jgi:hypothetical protein
MYPTVLSGAALSTLSTQGYLKVESFLTKELLAALTLLFDELMDTNVTDDKAIISTGNRDVVISIDKICSKGNLAALALLGYPPVMQIARQVCGDDFFMIQESAVIKNQGDNNPVLWHQDMVHGRSGHCITMGIYLDDVDAGDGALRVVPGSHLDNRKICALSQEPFIEVPMKAGDILIHDMMTAHCSEALVKRSCRRVIYFEFLSAAHALKENIYSLETIVRRSRLLFAANRQYQLFNPSAPSFIYPGHIPNNDDASKAIQDIVTDIYSYPVRARPSAYCLQGVSINSEF